MSNKEKLIAMAKNGVYTHNGSFHADDVWTSILLKRLGVVYAYGNGCINRVSDISNCPKNCLIYDIGLGQFDHHDPNNESIREYNMVKRAAFGIMWEFVGVEFMNEVIDKILNDTSSSEVVYDFDKETIKLITELRDAKDSIAVNAAENFDAKFVSQSDATDNYGPVKYPNMLSRAISLYNDNESDDNDMAFRACCRQFEPIFMKFILASIKYACTMVYVDNFLLPKAVNEKIDASKSIVHIPAYIIKDIDSIKAVVEKSNRGNNQYICTCKPGFMISKDVEVGTRGCVFVHPTRFLGSFIDKESALNVPIETDLSYYGYENDDTK